MFLKTIYIFLQCVLAHSDESYHDILSVLYIMTSSKGCNSVVSSILTGLQKYQCHIQLQALHRPPAEILYVLVKLALQT